MNLPTSAPQLLKTVQKLPEQYPENNARNVRSLGKIALMSVATILSYMMTKGVKDCQRTDSDC